MYIHRDVEMPAIMCSTVYNVFHSSVPGKYTHTLTSLASQPLSSCDVVYIVLGSVVSVYVFSQDITVTRGWLARPHADHR